MSVTSTISAGTAYCGKEQITSLSTGKSLSPPVECALGNSRARVAGHPNQPGWWHAWHSNIG